MGKHKTFGHILLLGKLFLRKKNIIAKSKNPSLCLEHEFKNMIINTHRNKGWKDYLFLPVYV